MMANLQEFLDRYHGEHSYSFSGKPVVKQKFNVTDKDLSNALSHSNIYTEFKQFRKPKLLPPIRTYKEGYLWEADLMFFTHPDFAEANDGYLYILTVIDSFTKMVSLKLLKNKNTAVVTKSMSGLFAEIKPEYLRVDAGGEFLSNTFTGMCKRNDVKMFIAMEPIKCAIVERFNRTFKRILVQIMDYNNSIKWTQFVPQALDIYHNRYHRTLKMTPNEADMSENQNKVLRLNLKRYAKFDRFYLKDLSGDKVIGSFYEEYLVPFSPQSQGEEFKLDPNFKDFKKKKINGVPYIWVKWMGWPTKFNQWVKEADLRKMR